MQIPVKVRRFVERVREKFGPEKIILFGSRVRGDWLKHSDYDFIIVSRKFEGTDFIGRAASVLRECEPEFGIDVLCYTPQEFEKKAGQITIVADALKHSIEL